MIQWQCRQCGEGIEVPESLASDAVECPQCGVFSRPPEELVPKIRTAPETLPVPNRAKPSKDQPTLLNPFPQSHKRPAERQAASLRNAGIILTLIAVAACFIAFVMPTDYNGTHNLGLLNNRVVVATIASGALVAGVVLYGIGLGTIAIVRAMKN
ncbi:MAG: hypothetical protein ACF8K1_13875 [Phycisphaerales bacterium JB047]